MLEITHLDDLDSKLLDARIQARAKLIGPQVGDIVKLTDGSTYQIVVHHGYDGRMQLGNVGNGRFYLCESGHGSYSGACGQVIREGNLSRTEEKQLATFWFFHHDHRFAHNGIDVQIPVTVWCVDDVMARPGYSEYLNSQKWNSGYAAVYHWLKWGHGKVQPGIRSEWMNHFGIAGQAFMFLSDQMGLRSNHQDLAWLLHDADACRSMLRNQDYTGPDIAALLEQAFQTRQAFRGV
jgi:hypothetical protein